jgi:hypothetical protein
VVAEGNHATPCAAETHLLPEGPGACGPGPAPEVAVDFASVRSAAQRTPSKCTKAPGGKSRGFSPVPAGRCADCLKVCGGGAAPAQAGFRVNHERPEGKNPK